MKKLIFSGALLTFCALSAMAQSGTNSPYSQYGLGLLSEQAQGFNRGMNGLAQGFRNGNEVNMLNPASYSAADSLTFILDAGLSGQVTNFKEGNVKVNANNADFEYAVALMRVAPKVGVSFGIVPFTNVGYSYSSTQSVSSSLSNSVTHSGNGSIREAYIGAGWQPLKGLSIGANIGYLWGSYERSVVNSTNQAYANTLSRIYSATVSSYKLDLGMQFQQRISKKDVVTLGATFGLGHKLGADAMLVNSNNDTQNNIANSDTLTVADAWSLPMSLGAGLAFCHNHSLTIGADYQLQAWGKEDYPVFDKTTNQYALKSGMFMDRHKMTVGVDWVPDPFAMRGLLKHVHYRMGASYATPYYKINGADGPKEISVSAGLGIPLVNQWNNRSVLNVSFQWARQSAPGLITENTFRFNIGLTFNERWFAKWKVD